MINKISEKEKEKLQYPPDHNSSECSHQPHIQARERQYAGINLAKIYNHLIITYHSLTMPEIKREFPIPHSVLELLNNAEENFEHSKFEYFAR